MDETGLPQLDTGLLNNTQSIGVQGHATGGAIKNLSPEMMTAAMIYGNYEPPKFQYAKGGNVVKWAMNEMVPAAEHAINKAKFLEPSQIKEVWYHGTPHTVRGEPSVANPMRKELHAQGITQFDPNRGKTGMTFAAKDPKFANDFAEQYGREVNGDVTKGTAPTVYPVHVQAKNPFDYQKVEHVNNLMNHMRENELFGPDENEKLIRQYVTGGYWDTLEQPNVQQAVKDLGHDSMYVNESGNKNIGLFDPGQIKSAIGNRGTYDPRDPHINRATGGPVHMAEGSIVEKALPHVGHAFAIEPAIDTAKALMAHHWGHALEGLSDLAQVYSPMKASVLGQIATYSPELNSNEKAELAKRQAMPALSVLNNPQYQ